MHLTAVFQKVDEGHIGFVEELPGANAQGAPLDEARAKLAEPVELVLQTNRAPAEKTIQGREMIREKMPLPAASNATTLFATFGNTAAFCFGKAADSRYS